MKNAYCPDDRFCFCLNTSWSMRLREFLRKIFKKEKILKEEIIYNRIFMADPRWFNYIVIKNTTYCCLMLWHRNLTHCTFTKQIFCSIFVFDLKEYIKPFFPILVPELVGGKGLSEANYFPFCLCSCKFEQVFNNVRAHLLR